MANEFIDLKRDSKRVDSPEAPSYPCLYLDDKTVMNGMKIGEEGEARIKYMVSTSGLEIRGIQFDGMKKGDAMKKEEY